jgi:hypothetical protein
MYHTFPSIRVFFVSAALTLIVSAMPVEVGLSQDAPGAPGAPTGGFDPSVIDAMAASMRQVPLTEDMVNRFIASYREMGAVGAKFPGTELPERPASGSTGSELDALPADKRRALEEVAAKYGFKTLDDWTAVASSVVMSYTYAKQGKRPGALEQAVKVNIAEAQEDPKMTDEQKRVAIAQYRELGAKLARLEPLKENFELIEKMKNKVASIMEAK